ncbi:hypothetical protein ACFL1L_05365 [Thermoplasmatota archaeon]
MISLYIGDYVKSTTSLLDLVRIGDAGVIVEIENHPELIIIHWKSGDAEGINTTVRKEYIRKISKKEAMGIINKRE